jgi:hypothetical protein
MFGPSSFDVKDSIMSQTDDDRPVKKSKTTSNIENNNNPKSGVEPFDQNDDAPNDGNDEISVINDNGDTPANENGDAQVASFVINDDGDKSFLADQSELDQPETALQDALAKLSGDDAADVEVSASSSLKLILLHILCEQKKMGLFVNEISRKTSKKNRLLTVSNSFSHITIYRVNIRILNSMSQT